MILRRRDAVIWAALAVVAVIAGISPGPPAPPPPAPPRVVINLLPDGKLIMGPGSVAATRELRERIERDPQESMRGLKRLHEELLKAVPKEPEATPVPR